MRFTVFDRWGTQTGVVSGIIGASHRDELNGEDSLTLTLATGDLAKGERIVWRDRFGTWHEHIVSDVTTTHEDGKVVTVAYCETSLNEMHTDYVEELRPYGVSATVALQRVLAVTRWEVGTVDDLGTASASLYHMSAREALSAIADAWGGELSATIEVGGTGVARRFVNLTLRGSDGGKRFEWAKDMRGISREVSTDDVCTALYGYGVGLECYDEDGNPTGGYERRLTFGEINGGKDYVADEDAKQLWGLPDGSGGKRHAFGKAEFDDCDNMTELLALTRAELERRKVPQVSYTASVVDLADAGYAYEDVRTGDTVAIIDRELGERLRGRVLCVRRDLLDEGETIVTLGNVTRSISDVISGQLAAISGLRDHATAWDGAARISESYINGVIRVWNGTMNATGGYVYQVPGEGITLYDRPEDQNPTMAMQLKGAGLRIANGKTSAGEWDWRTFGTGDGFAADCLNVGTIRGGSNHWNLETGDLTFEQGMISTADGSSYWDMTNNEVHLSSGTVIGESTAGGITSSITRLRSDLTQTAQALATTYTSLTASIAHLEATFGICDTAASVQCKDVECPGFGSLAEGSRVTVHFMYANTADLPQLKVNDLEPRGIEVNGSPMGSDAWWAAFDVLTFVYDGNAWTVEDGGTLRGVTTNREDIASLTITAQELSVGLRSVTTSVSELEATRGAFWCRCATEGTTQAKEADCDGFALHTGVIVSVSFAHANAVASPTLNVASTGARPIYLNGSAIPQKSWWGDGEVVTLVYSGSHWAVTDGSTLTQLTATKTSVASLSVRSDEFALSIKGVQATYGICQTDGDVQTKVVTIAGFTKYVGQTVTVMFSYGNDAASPKLMVQNSDGSVAATGYILTRNAVLSESDWWGAGDTMTLVWDGFYWRVGDGSTMSQIKTLKDSITLSVTGSLGGTASIKLSVGDSEQAKSIDLSKVRQAFRDDNTAIAISAGTVTFNSNTIAINATNFTLTAGGAVTANSFTGYGWFQCGSASGYHIILSSSGELEGYVGATKYGYINYAGTSLDLDTGATKRGMQIQASEVVRISTPRIAVAASSNVSTTATWAKTGTMSQQVVKEIHDNGSGSIGWSYGTMSLTFINGFCTNWGTF